MENTKLSLRMNRSRIPKDVNDGMLSSFLALCLLNS